MSVYIDWTRWASEFREELITGLGLSVVEADKLAVRWAAVGVERGWSQQTTRQMALDCFESDVDIDVLRRALLWCDT